VRWGPDDDVAEPDESRSTIRGLFRLDRHEPWSIDEDTFCFDCGNTRDRTGELQVSSERDDIEAITDASVQAWHAEEPMLVAVDRPSDSILELRWPGILNIGWAPSEAVVVLRSWEERFGAVP
jgi:hypothetical protein